MNYTGCTGKGKVLCQNGHCMPTTSTIPKRAAAMIPPLLKCQKSTVLNTLCESDRPTPTQVLLLPKSSGDQNVPQPKASGDQNVHQHQKATFEVSRRIMQAIIFTKTPWSILSNEKYSIAEEAWKVAIEVKDCQWASASAPVGIPSVWQFPDGRCFNIDLQTLEQGSLESHLIIL